MIDSSLVRRIQERCGLPAAQRDGKIGPVTLDAIARTLGIEQPKILNGDGTWPWTAEIDGGDIVIRKATCTAFGGASDNMDSGETASGINTARNPSFVGCALPLRRDSLYDSKRGQYVLRGSPLPSGIPFRTRVVFTDPETGKSVETQLIDIGPAKWTGNAGDLTAAAARVFDPKATANRFKRVLDIRIVGGAKFVS